MYGVKGEAEEKGHAILRVGSPVFGAFPPKKSYCKGRVNCKPPPKKSQACSRAPRLGVDTAAVSLQHPGGRTEATWSAATQ